VKRAEHAKERTIVSRGKKDLAAVVPIEDLRLLDRMTKEETDRRDIEAAHEALKEPGGSTALRDLTRQLGD
jgi:hypothetical protein